uniref:Internal scaffolding protein ORF3 n=1 Tax=Spiroplasma virus 4 TaxID=2928746 RepID=B_SPV4|nr:RecName: Full=Internal scaffolding protein ORF3 [Spiroplasma phage 4]
MKIYTQRNNKVEFSDSGSSEYSEYQRVIDADTKENTYEIVATYNRYDEIQEAGEGTDLRSMLDKYGDDYLELLPPARLGGDDTILPKSVLELENIRLQNTEYLSLLENINSKLDKQGLGDLDNFIKNWQESQKKIENEKGKKEDEKENE